MWLRILSAAVLAPLVLLLLFKLPVNGVLLLIGVLLAAVAWEGSALVGFKSSGARAAFTVALILVGIAGYLFMPAERVIARWVLGLGFVAFCWWLLYIAFLSRFSVSSPGVYGSPVGRMVNIAFVLLSTWLTSAALLLHDPREPLLFVYVMVMIWIADSGAYFAGKFLGKRKLAINVSPGKTIEGVIGGLVAVGVYALVYGKFVLNLGGNSLLAWLLLGIVVSAISVAGDLNESALKRVAGVKDSGNIIPGHGGLFDRVDAITAAIPVFYFGWRVLNWGMAA